MKALSAVPCLGLMLFAFALPGPVWADSGEITFNQLPNPEFRGDGGFLESNVTGPVPSLWRSFAVGESTATTAIVPVAAGELFAGSPAVNAVELTVTNFGPPATSDAGFDTSPNQFTLIPGQAYGATVYLRSNNADLSPQTVLVQLPIFDNTGTFTGTSGSVTVEATSSWTAFEMPVRTTNLPGATGEVSFRLAEGAADNSVQIALPSVAGPSLANRVPNPEFSGTGGIPVENATGEVPDLWRAFGLVSESANLSLEKVPVAADELYPGSPATTAIRLSTSVFTGSGFDHEITQVSLAPAGRRVWAEVYLRADNADNSNQEVSFQMPIFESNGAFSGQSPGSVNVVATPQWKYFTGTPFSGDEGQTFNLGFRLIDSGTENTVLIALPTLKGLAETVFDSDFEAATP